MGWIVTIILSIRDITKIKGGGAVIKKKQHIHRCSVCGRKTKKQFQDLRHCLCGISYIKKNHRWQAFVRTSDMKFTLNHNKKAVIKSVSDNKEYH